MANIYLKKILYDKIIKLGLDPSTFTNECVEKAIKELDKK